MACDGVESDSWLVLDGDVVWCLRVMAVSFYCIGMHSCTGSVMFVGGWREGLAVRLYSWLSFGGILCAT